MIIEFRKVPKEGFDFSVQKDGIDFSGYAVKEKETLLRCSGKLQGTLAHACDRCGEDLMIDLNEEIEVWASNGILEGTEEELINIIEFADEKVDFDEIMDSEVEALKSDYFYCQKCQNIENLEGE